MARITVNVVDMGAAAEAGAVRWNIGDTAHILIHSGLPVDEQSALLAELTRPGELPVILNDLIPAQRVPEGAATPRQSSLATGLRVAAAATSVAAFVSQLTPPGAG